jgi:hypothetical protein
MLQQSQYEANILNTYSQAGTIERKEGKRWYQEAHDFANDVALKTDLPLHIVAGVMAVLSPQCRWSVNKRWTFEACTDNPYNLSGTLKLSKGKAIRILEYGEEPLSVINGAPKTQAFYHNILNAGKDNHVTIDVHAIRCAYNNPNHDGRFPRREYPRVEAAYQTVAKFKGLTPPQLQAVCWIVQRQPQRRLI